MTTIAALAHARFAWFLAGYGALLPGASPPLVMALALPVTLVFAVLSWELVERPTLARRRQIGGLLDARLRRRPGVNV